MQRTLIKRKIIVFVVFTNCIVVVTGLFADMPIRGLANSRTRQFADSPIRGQDVSRTCQFADAWTIRGETFRGQAGLFADKLFEVTIERYTCLFARTEIVNSQTN